MILKCDHAVANGALSPSQLEPQKCLSTRAFPRSSLRYLMRLPDRVWLLIPIWLLSLSLTQSQILYDGTDHSTQSTNSNNHNTSAVALSHPDKPSSVASFINLPKELLAIIFDFVDVQDRYTFALSCKAAARYCTADPMFLALPVVQIRATKPKVKGWWRTIEPNSSSTTTIMMPGSRHSSSLKFHSLNGNNSNNSFHNALNLSRTKIFRDLMQLLSKGWVGAQWHWCDQCHKFRHFDPETRRSWYSFSNDLDLEKKDIGNSRNPHSSPELLHFVTPSNEKGAWEQELGLSVDELVCWNHWCPACSLRRRRGGAGAL